VAGRSCRHADLVLKLALAIIAIALPDCVNPSLIAGELFVATGPHPRRRAAAFALAALIVTFAFGLAIALGLGDLIRALVPKPGKTLKYALITAAGVVLMVGGLVIWLRRKALVTARAERRPSHGSPVVLGASIAGVELLTAFPYFAAIAIIAGSDVSNLEKLLLLALYCVVYVLPLIIIAALLAIMGERAERLLLPVGAWFTTHWPWIVAPMTEAFGIGVFAFGIVQLSST
jgi:cytochrome c biogenesis protein CcdA